MKKLILGVIISLISIVGFGQTRAPKGITIGDHRVPGTNIDLIDSVTFDGTAYIMWNNNDTAFVYEPYSERVSYDAAWKGYNTPVSTGNIDASVGLTTAMLHPQLYYNGNSSINIVENPQIADGVAGQIITIIGSSDTNTLILDDGAGLALTGQCVLGIRDSITLMYNVALDVWIQLSVNNNN